MDLEQEEFVQATWDREVLPGQALEQWLFEGCTFRRCNFSGASFKGSRFFNCRFEHCDLSNAAFDNANLRAPLFSACKLIGVAWARTQRLDGPAFDDCLLNDGNFKGLKLPKLRLKDCVAKQTDFSTADLSGADFSGTDLTGSLFFKSDLSRADFRSARNYSLFVDQCTVKGAKFSYPEVMALLHGLEIVIGD